MTCKGYYMDQNLCTASEFESILKKTNKGFNNTIFHLRGMSKMAYK